jgi:hypothetical protein
MRALYVGIGDEPVGRPRTKGFSAVGLKSLILDWHVSKVKEGHGEEYGPARDIVGNV